ncbi:ArsR/SmtB family transcription factor [Campylobacter californiensis]|uniref:ArsR/SmtB family transcription factor n=1 Tax=Campylobacter californiensis TaxID=1032243 RepID=UPI0014751C01|nr:metalloregulator ArsR/SmtB family transcription factor [Campylobacter sp. RM12916]MBE3609289.1 winged helix-turn-helix transcriptional regulator [Campylobacter sp. RM12916]
MQYVDIFELKSDFMRALAHPLRVQIVEILGDKSMSVSEICESLNKEQATISKHLSVLKSAEILKGEKSGLHVFYSVDICCLPNFLECINRILEEKITKNSKNARSIIKNLR